MSAKSNPRVSTLWRSDGTVDSKSLLIRMFPSGVVIRKLPSCSVPMK